MKLLAAIRNKLGGIANAIIRFPVTFLLLVSVAAIISISIENNNDYGIELISLVLAVFCSLAAQVLSERFSKTNLTKIIIYICAAAISVGNYLLVRNIGDVNIIVMINTGVAVFALFISFIWIPSFKNHADFNVVFMSVFKSLFTSAFYSGVIWGGISLILIAVDTLLVKLNGNVYGHTANIIWVVWAPMLLLSLIPIFGKDDADNEKVQKASVYPKFLEIALSYILVPLAAVYTLVLLLYIVKTIISGNWNDNLLEPLMLSYCIAILLIYILVSRLENRFAKIFLKIFPIFLTVVALFQIISTMIIVSSFGIVHSRYFVLMFGLYAVICGILLYVLPVKKNGIIAVLAICFAVVCITPYINSFSVSIASQKSMIENTLKKNNMLSENTITPKSDLPEGDKHLLSRSVSYFSQINQLKQLEYIPENFNIYENFEKTFGFKSNDMYTPGEQTYRSYASDTRLPIEITGFDYLTRINMMMPGSSSEEFGIVNVNGNQYHFILAITGFTGQVKITDSDNNEIISVQIETLFDKIYMLEPISGKNLIAPDLMTFDFENDSAKIRFIFNNVSISDSSIEKTRYADCNVLYTIY